MPNRTNGYRDYCLDHKTEQCVVCGSEDNVDVHHIDGDSSNNDLENLVPICRTHHLQIHHGVDDDDLRPYVEQLPDSSIIDRDPLAEGESFVSECETIETGSTIYLFQYPADVKVLVVLENAVPFDLSTTEIVERADISRSEWYDIKSRLIELELIEETRKIGNTPMYTVRSDSDTSQAFSDLRDTMNSEPPVAAATE